MLCTKTSLGKSESIYHETDLSGTHEVDSGRISWQNGRAIGIFCDESCARYFVDLEVPTNELAALPAQVLIGLKWQRRRNVGTDRKIGGNQP